MKRKYKLILLVLGIPFLLFIIGINVGLNNNETDSEYYKKTNLKFNGIVKKVKPLTSYGHDYGVISIDISNSNKEEYDPRDTLERFLGVIKNDKADLVFNRMSEIKTGDSIDFNVQEFKVYRNGKLIRKSTAGMPPDDIFMPFNEVNENITL